MNKSVLVIDTPTQCIDCPLYLDDACFVTETVVKDGIADDCPLRPLPQKETCNEYDFEHYKNGVAIGWNRCIEKIIGEDNSQKERKLI